jgi:predicted ATP-dependent endonuclease of OLD family
MDRKTADNKQNMRIEKVVIHNWRSIADEEIDFEELMIFIGQNNHGKSNIISSLLFFFGTITHSVLDFHGSSNELFVEITFTNLDEFDQSQFKKYLSPDNKIKVRKSVSDEGEVAYNGYLFAPTTDFLKEESILALSKREEVERTPLKDFIPSSGRLTKDIIKAAQEEYTTANHATLEFQYVLEQSTFLGAKNVAKGIFGDVYFIPAVKNATDEFKMTGNSIFNQLFSQIIGKMSERNEYYKSARTQMQALTQILNKKNEKGDDNTERPIEITTLEQNLENELKKWNTTIDIEITPPNIDDVLKVNTSVWVDDGKKTDISRKGHGLQRSLIFALIKSWAAYLKTERETKAEEEALAEATTTPKRKASDSTYFFFEEPELYLHPQAQKELYASLKELSLSHNQIVLSTHSASFLDLEDYKSICIVNKVDTATGSKVKQFTTDIFEGDDKTNFNLVYWINPERSELFFAKKVILVEGATDKTIIPRLAKATGHFNFEYTVIECGGKDSIKLYIKLLNSFRIPYVAVYDKDHQAYKDVNGHSSADISSAGIEAVINAGFGKSVILINDIEEEIGITERNDKAKPYLALTQIASPEFTLSPGLAEKISTIYE